MAPCRRSPASAVTASRRTALARNPAASSSGAGWQVIEEGQPSRTTVRDDPIEGSHKNGLRALPVCLELHMPLDLVILMLGTNDLKQRFAAIAQRYC